jgi:glycerate 2-kinase
MKFLLVPDKFKGSLSASAVCEAIRNSLKEINQDTEIVSVPMADGGEGTFEILMNYFKGKSKKITVLDPLFRPIYASYGISSDGTTALIEMARASGLQLLKSSERNPLHTSSYGTGELILDALNQGVKKIIVGIGGSATNDAGIGLANALGYQFLNSKEEVITPIGSKLADIVHINSEHVHAALKKTKFIVLCDVTNPLYGEQGAAQVYGPQKGATAEIVQLLDAALMHFAEIVKSQSGVDMNFSGAGAAGGIGGGAKVFLNATLKSGIDFLSELTGLEEEIKKTDHVITGEGKLDIQTLSGKVVSHVVNLGSKYHKPVTIICGQCTLSPTQLAEHGLNNVIVLAKDFSEVKEAITNPVKKINERIHSDFSFLNL